MSRARRSRPTEALLLACAALVLAGCAEDQPGTSITVTAGSDTCRVSRDSGDGPLGFWVVNVGEAATAVSLYDSDGRLVTGLDDVGPAMWQTMAANVYEGEFEIRCQPVDGAEMRAAITVSPG